MRIAVRIGKRKYLIKEVSERGLRLVDREGAEYLVPLERCVRPGCMGYGPMAVYAVMAISIAYLIQKGSFVSLLVISIGAGIFVFLDLKGRKSLRVWTPHGPISAEFDTLSEACEFSKELKKRGLCGLASAFSYKGASWKKRFFPV